MAVATQARTKPVIVTVPHDEFRELYVDIMARIEQLGRRGGKPREERIERVSSRLALKR